jgi:hypothetical protein
MEVLVPQILANQVVAALEVLGQVDIVLDLDAALEGLPLELVPVIIGH